MSINIKDWTIIPGIESLNNKESIYHYTTAQALKNIIVNDEFWITHAFFLNDYSEMIYIEKIIKSVCKELVDEDTTVVEADTLKDNLCEEIMDKYRDFSDLNYKTFALSFSTNDDSLTLWSEFSNFHGYNIEYNIKEFREYLKKSIKVSLGVYEVYEGKIIYNYEQQKTLIKELFKLEFENANAIQKDKLSKITLEDLCATSFDIPEKINTVEHFYKMFVSKLLFYAAFFKGDKFKNEEEYRFILKFKGNIEKYKFKELNLPEEYNGDCLYEKELNFREKDGIIVPYITLQLPTIEGKKLPIKHIVIGAKNNCDLAIEGTKFLLKHNGHEECSNNTLRKSEITLRY